MRFDSQHRRTNPNRSSHIESGTDLSDVQPSLEIADLPKADKAGIPTDAEKQVARPVQFIVNAVQFAAQFGKASRPAILRGRGVFRRDLEVA